MLSNRAWWQINIRYYSLWFLLVSLVIFLPYWMSGTSLVWQSDGITQHFAALAQWQQDLKQLFSTGQWPAQWSWDIGLGADYYQTFSYYTLGDVFTYGVGLVSTQHLLAYYETMLIIRLFLAGLAILWAIKYFTHSQNALINTLTSLAYVFTGYTAFSAFEHPFFINPLIILPLLAVSFDYLLKHKRMVPFTLMVFWTLWNNYYFAFMLFLGLGIYWLIETTITHKWADWQRHIRMLSAGLIGALMAMALFLPNVLGVLSSSRSGAPLANGLITYPLYYYLALPGTLLVNEATPNFWFTGGLATVFILALVFTLRRWRQYKVLTSLFLVAGIGLFIPAFAAMFNGGSSPSNRWTFLLALPLAIATVHFLNKLDELTTKDWQWFSILGVVMFSSLYITSGFSFQNSFGFLLVLYVLTLFLVKNATFSSRSTHKIHTLGFSLTVITALNVITLMTHTHETDFKPNESTMLSRQTVQKLLAEQKDYPTEAISKASSHQRSLIDNPLYNAKGIAPGNNLAMLSPAHPIDSYWSYQNGATNQFMKSLGILTSTNNDVTSDLNNRSTISHILGINQVFQQADKPSMLNYQANGKINQQRMSTTEYAYPLAYVAPNVTSQATFDKATPSHREALLVDSVITDDRRATSAQFVDELVTGKIHQRKLDEPTSTLHYSYTTKPDNDRTGFYLAANPNLKNTELHLELTNIKFVPNTFNQTYQSDFAAYKFKHNELEDESQSPDRLYNPTAFKWQWYKEHLGDYGSAMGGYSITAKYNDQKQKFTQTSQKNLSFFNPRSSATINLGAATNIDESQFIALKFSQPGTYTFDVAVVGVPTDKRFTDHAKRVQNSAVPMTLEKDTLTANFRSAKSEIITTSIPFSSGWQSDTNELIKVNNGFLGIKTQPGKNDIHLYYQTPGLRIGVILSLIGFLLFICLLVGHYLLMKQPASDNDPSK